MKKIVGFHPSFSRHDKKQAFCAWLNKNVACVVMIATVIALTSCHEEEDQLFATAIVSLRGSGDGVTITGVQAQARLTNVNTRQTTTSAAFSGETLTVELLRGAYQILIEGVVTCSDSTGRQRIRQFRAQTDYTELAGKGVNQVTLDIIYLD